MESSAMAREASLMAPIDVDRDSEETLSSDGDVEMEEDADFQIRPATSRLRAPTNAPQPSTPPTPTTSTLSASMATARGNLLSAAASHVQRTDLNGGGDARPANGKIHGKKRRLSPSPSPSPSSSPETASNMKRKPLSRHGVSVLDFHLPQRTPPPKERRTTQLIDDDEDEGTVDEEMKGDRPATPAASPSHWPDATEIVTKTNMANRIEATRTWICGEWFGKCVLDFHSVYVQLQLYSLPTRDGSSTIVFAGSLTCRQLNRFSLSSGDPPCFAILQLERVGAGPTFGEFCDASFAKATEKNGPSIELNIYGAVLFFKDDLDIARCRSLSDLSKVLGALLDVPVTDEEAAQIRRLKEPRIGSPPRAERSSTNMLSMITGKMKGTLNSITTLFTPDRSPTKMRQGKLSFDNTAESSDPHATTMSSRFRTSSRRKSLLQQRSPRDVEVVVQLSGETDPDSGEPEKDESKKESPTAERRSTRNVMRLQRQHLKMETERLHSERKSTLLLTYPFDDADRPGQITITYGDIDRLKPGEFLNDSIIDFYIRYLWRNMEPWQRDQVYFFSSHFFTQLSGGKISGNVTLPEERLRRISRWTQKENLFEKRFLFVPINDSCHWSIIVICNINNAIVHKRKKVRKNKSASKGDNRVELVDVDAVETTVIDTTEDASDSEEEESMHKERMLHPPCVLFLDSLQCHPKKKIGDLIKSYLEYEFKARFKTLSEGDFASRAEVTTVATFDAESIKIIVPEIPLQSNSSDCGVFLLMYTAQILQRFPAGLSQDDVATKLASSVSKQMFDQGHVQEFRDYLHQLIFTLAKIKRRGGHENSVRAEGLDFFAIEN